jgi:hypothetical protein|tara:strand:- start:5047 stop:5616 length:570 start_codon:yes stop_codon:yes gene_type:complete
MTFWQDPNLEPKRSFKFILSIPGGNNTTGISEFLVKKVKKPEWEIGSIEHKFLNHSFYYPGKVKWSPLDITVVDTVDPTANASKQIMHILEESGYELPTTPTITEGWGTVSKAKAANNALGNITIKTIDSDGVVVEEWVLNNAWVTKVAMGELTYDDEALVEVTLSLQYDNAFIDIKGQGGGPIPSTST